MVEPNPEDFERERDPPGADRLAEPRNLVKVSP